MSTLCILGIASATTLTSTDGISWTTNAGALPTNGSWYSLAFGNGIFCAIRYNSNEAATSTDGVTWTSRTLPASTKWWKIIFNGSIFCAITSSADITATSSDGITWTQGALPSVSTWLHLTWNGSAFFAASSANAKVAYSSDGLSWTATSTLPSNNLDGGLAWNGSLLCGITASTTQGWTTSDSGATWDARTIINKQWSKLIWNGTVFCAISNSANCMVSSDGITWTSYSMPSNANWMALTWDGNQFIAAAYNTTKCATSPNGQTWTARTLSASSFWEEIASDYVYTPPSFLGTPVQGLIVITGLRPTSSVTIPFFSTPDIGIINFTGQEPKQSQYVFYGHPSQLQLIITGLQSNYALGFAPTAGQVQITLTGQQPGFINRSLKAIAPDWVATRYQCFLGDLELPISSFQTRLTSTTTYLAIVIKGVDAWIDEIIARDGGALSIYRIYDYLDGSSATFFIASALFDTLQTSQGARSGTTGTLSGSENMSIVTPITLQLTGAVTRSYDSGGIRYRCKIDPRAKPLDTVTINGETFVLESVIHIIDTKTSIMEIKEKLA
jgi:hypothetical protein